MSAHLILTVDYELFGDGSGSLRKCVVEPARRLMETAEAHGARITFFVEALEFDAMLRLDERGGGDQSPDALGEVRQQLRRAVDSGHDVQLHLHPQWRSARPASSEGWRVDTTRWRLGDHSGDEIREMLGRGIRFLRDTLDPVAPGYRPRVFRAGGWCIQPSAQVLDGLRDEGFLIDSSVAPGLHHPARGDWYDFRDAPEDRASWPVSRDVCRPSPSGTLWEVPIAVGSVPAVRHVFRILSGRVGGSSGFPNGCSGSFGGANDRYERWRGYIARLKSAHLAMLDFCRLPASMLLDVADEWIEERSEGESGELPLVAIGHNKTFDDSAETELSLFLERLEDRADIRFGTFGSWLEEGTDLPGRRRS